MNMYCFNCETRVPENASACPQCGHPLKAATGRTSTEKSLHPPNTSPLLGRIARHPATIISLGIAVFASLAMYAKTEPSTPVQATNTVEKKSASTIDSDRHFNNLRFLAGNLQNDGYVDKDGYPISVQKSLQYGVLGSVLYYRTEGNTKFKWKLQGLFSAPSFCVTMYEGLMDESIGRDALEEWQEYAIFVKSENFRDTGRLGIQDLIDQWLAEGDPDEADRFRIFNAKRSTKDYDFEFMLVDDRIYGTEEDGEYVPAAGKLSISFELKSK